MSPSIAWMETEISGQEIYTMLPYSSAASGTTRPKIISGQKT